MAADFKVVKLPMADVCRAFGMAPDPMIVYGGVENGMVVGIGGLVWKAGICWLFLDVVDRTKTHPMTVVRMAKSMLSKARMLGDAHVYAARDDEPHSKRLLEMLGFEPVASVPSELGGVELWRHSPPLPQLRPGPLPSSGQALASIKDTSPTKRRRMRRTPMKSPARPSLRRRSAMLKNAALKAH